MDSGIPRFLSGERIYSQFPGRTTPAGLQDRVGGCLPRVPVRSGGTQGVVVCGDMNVAHERPREERRLAYRLFPCIRKASGQRPER